MKVINGRFHFNSYLYVTSTDSTTTMQIGTWISRDGTMCFVGGSSSNNTLYTFTASLLHYVVADSASTYASGLHSDGTYYKPLFGSLNGSMNAFALDTSSFAGTSAYNVNITGLTGDYGFNGVSVAIPQACAYGDVYCNNFFAVGHGEHGDHRHRLYADVVCCDDRGNGFDKQRVFCGCDQYVDGDLYPHYIGRCNKLGGHKVGYLRQRNAGDPAVYFVV